MAKLTESRSSMFSEPNYAIVSTVRPDGSPHQTVVWVDYDGENVVFNTADGRAKPKYIRQNPNVGITVLDPENPFRWISVSGPAEIDEEGAAEHIEKLSFKYNGKSFGLDPAEKRLIVRIKPEKVTAVGLD